MLGMALAYGEGSSGEERDFTYASAFYSQSLLVFKLRSLGHTTLHLHVYNNAMDFVTHFILSYLTMHQILALRPITFGIHTALSCA